MLLHARESNWVLDSKFHTVDSGFQVLDSGFFVSGPLIPESKLYLVGSGFLVLYSGFQSLGFWFSQENFPRFQIPQAKIFQFPECRFSYMGQYHCSFHQLPKPGVLPQMPLKLHQYTLGDIVLGTHKITEDCESDGIELDTYLPVSHAALLYSSFVLHISYEGYHSGLWTADYGLGIPIPYILYSYFASKSWILASKIRQKLDPEKPIEAWEPSGHKHWLKSYGTWVIHVATRPKKA